MYWHFYTTTSVSMHWNDWVYKRSNSICTLNYGAFQFFSTRDLSLLKILLYSHRVTTDVVKINQYLLVTRFPLHLLSCECLHQTVKVWNYTIASIWSIHHSFFTVYETITYGTIKCFNLPWVQLTRWPGDIITSSAFEQDTVIFGNLLKIFWLFWTCIVR